MPTTKDYFREVEKDPDATLDYQFWWNEWLVDDDEISASTWDADDGITIGLSAHTENTTTAWLSGGSAGRSYRVTNHIITTDGREDDRTLLVKVVNK